MSRDTGVAPEEVYTAAEEFGEHFLLHFKFNQNQQVRFFESDSLESGSSGVKHIIIHIFALVFHWAMSNLHNSISMSMSLT